MPGGSSRLGIFGSGRQVGDSPTQGFFTGTSSSAAAPSHFQASLPVSTNVVHPLSVHGLILHFALVTHSSKLVGCAASPVGPSLSLRPAKSCTECGHAFPLDIPESRFAHLILHILHDIVVRLKCLESLGHLSHAMGCTSERYNYGQLARAVNNLNVKNQ